ncbi:MAG: DUF2914 domain-containing protein [Betaproteobacteria bacterium]|nr:DUF2914 domain-containing protein [Betaproteobacteria bacterium]
MSQETTRDASNNTLKIRIQIQQPQPQAIEELYPEPEVTYEETLDWNKIAIAAVLLLSLLALTGYLLFASGDEERVPADSTATTISGDAAPQEKTEPQLGTANGTNATQPSELIGTQPPPSKPAKSKTVNNPVKSVVIPARKPQFNATVKLANPADSAEKKTPKTAAQVKPQASTDQAEVVRAQLSHAIEAREPVDSIDAVHLQPGESKPIYFYLHLKNLQGKNVRIDWYYNDKLDSRLSLRVHNNNWRTHASKQMDQRRLGAWRVELIDEAGNRLAARNFTVTQP